MREGIGYVIAIIIIIGLIIGGSLLEIKHDREVYNEGMCTECQNGQYQFYQAVGARRTKTYIYQCDNCHHIIELYEIMD